MPLKAFFLVSIISNTEINIFLVYKLKGGLLYNTDCFSYWQGTIQASYAVMRQLLLSFRLYVHSYLYAPNFEKVDGAYCFWSVR